MVATRAPRTAKKLLRAASDELGLTTPKSVKRRPAIVKKGKKAGSRVKKF
jgi:hypothetical protein